MDVVHSTNRRPDWVARLRTVIAVHRKSGFKYGQTDCALLAARCVDAVTGSEIEQQLAYKDMRTALRFLKHVGGLEAGITRMLGQEPIIGHCVRRADICLISSTAAGVCTGTEVMAYVNHELVPLPLSSVQKYWRV